MAIITISRQFGSQGEAVAEVLAEATGYTLLNKRTLEGLITEKHVPDIRLEWINESSPRRMEELEEKRVQYIEFLKVTISELAEKKHIFMLGRGCQFLFQAYENAVHFRVIAPLEIRAGNIQRRFGVDKATALRLINEKDAERNDYNFYFHRGDWNDPELYNLTLNTGTSSLAETAGIILYFLRERDVLTPCEYEDIKSEVVPLLDQKLRDIADGTFQRKVLKGKDGPPVFANESEEEFARILDYYKIEYLYEPTTFPLRWDSEGNIESAFAPDFYFPDFDLYIELTTMKQQLVTKKNRKLRELRKLYPHVNIKLFYRRDYHKLLKKFGIDKG
ncbi:MAG: hypothetical protein GX318_05555 [Clostridia bacterium]|nr:hypothetical protein [Clostridia bacterium]